MENQPLNRIATGSFYLIFDQIVTYGLGALFWIILAKMVATSFIGQTMAVIALTTVILGFTGLGAQVTISKFIAEHQARKNQEGSKKAFRYGLKLGLGISGVAAVLFAIFSGQVAQVLFHDTSVTVLIAIATLAYLPSQTIISCFFGAFQGFHKMKYTAFTDLIFQVTRISIVISLVLLNAGSLSLIVSFAAASILTVAVAYAFFVRRLFARVAADVSTDVKPKEGKATSGMLSFSRLNYLATGIATLAAQLNYLLLGGQDFGFVALFGISTLISGIVGAIVTSFGRAILPTASVEYGRTDTTQINAAVSLAFKVSIMISGFIYILLLVAPGLLLSSLSQDYLAASSALRILVISAIVSSLSGFITSILNGANRARLVANIAMAAGITVISASVILVPRFGVEGAALAALMGSSVSFLLSVWRSGKVEGLSISYKSIYKPLLSAAIAILLGYTVISLHGSAYIALVLSFVIYIALILGMRTTNKEEVRHIAGIAYQVVGRGAKK